MDKFEIVSVEMRPEGIQPGEPGNPIGKADGDMFGATIKIRHSGLGGPFDVGWFAYLSEKMNGATITNVFEPHGEPTLVIVEVSNIWTNHPSIGQGATIGAQPVIAVAGAMVGLSGWVDKLQPAGYEAAGRGKAIKWAAVAVVYQVVKEAVFDFPIEEPYGYF